MPDLQFHPEADAEYAAAIQWYENRSVRAADRFELEVENTLQRICSSPDVFARYDEIHRYALIHRFPYSLVYRTFNEVVYVVAVAHGSRSPGYWLDRK